MRHKLERPIHASWIEELQPVLEEQLPRIIDFLDGREFLPSPEQVFRALSVPMDQVRVVILGQDPYPTPGHPMGLAFSTAPGVSAPKSLRNIHKELLTDVGVLSPTDGDLTAWEKQGVLLLNRVLTVEPGKAGSHRGIGWEEVTAEILKVLNRRVATGHNPGLSAILWGKDAQKAGELLPHAFQVTSPHPSPLSAYRGFFDSHPFSQVNEHLLSVDVSPIDWRL